MHVSIDVVDDSPADQLASMHARVRSLVAFGLLAHMDTRYSSPATLSPITPYLGGVTVAPITSTMREIGRQSLEAGDIVVPRR